MKLHVPEKITIMIQTVGQIFATGTKDQIISLLETALKGSNESPMWVEKSIPLSKAVLSVLIPLRDQNLLFSPEGKPEATLSTELFIRYCDLANLKWLAFTLQQSNDADLLQRTKYSADDAERYRTLDLSELGSYLSGYTVNLEDEWLDFPIANYNLHIGVTDLLRKLV